MIISPKPCTYTEVKQLQANCTSSSHVSRKIVLQDSRVVSISKGALSVGACAALMLEFKAVLLDDGLHGDVDIVRQQLVAMALLAVVRRGAHVPGAERRGVERSLCGACVARNGGGCSAVRYAVLDPGHASNVPLRSYSPSVLDEGGLW